MSLSFSHRIALLTCCLASSATWATTTWQCHNVSAEITCTKDSCDINPQGSFTPFHVTAQIAQNKAQLSVCAYSGCWQGKAKLFKDQSHQLFSAQALQWSHTNAMQAERFIFAVDRKTQVGFIQGAGFAMPLQCVEET